MAALSLQNIGHQYEMSRQDSAITVLSSGRLEAIDLLLTGSIVQVVANESSRLAPQEMANVMQILGKLELEQHPPTRAPSKSAIKASSKSSQQHLTNIGWVHMKVQDAFWLPSGAAIHVDMQVVTKPEDQHISNMERQFIHSPQYSPSSFAALDLVNLAETRELNSQAPANSTRQFRTCCGASSRLTETIVSEVVKEASAWAPQGVANMVQRPNSIELLGTTRFEVGMPLLSAFQKSMATQSVGGVQWIELANCLEHF